MEKWARGDGDGNGFIRKNTEAGACIETCSMALNYEIMTI